MPRIDVHPAANIVPMLEGAAYESLKEDIRTNGQQVPVVLWKGSVIDGRNRMRVCHELGVSPRTIELDSLPNESPTMYVLSANLHRRHLSPSQLAMVAARARDQFDREAKLRQARLAHASGDARDLAGRAVGVSGKSVDYATRVLKDGVPELVSACDAGRLAVSRAARMVELPAQDQRAVLAAPREQRRSNVRSQTRFNRPSGTFRIERQTTFAAFDQLVTRARDLASFVEQRCGSVGPLFEQGQFDRTVLETGVEQIEQVASALLRWSKRARQELRMVRAGRTANTVHLK
jgi:hypothetical protein